jgi:8-oxo-dGTP pyrophosphatase MutT (NUDIX family)
MDTGELPRDELPSGSHPTSAGCAQVAAVCYRVRGATLDFLLVRTRKGRWTFPKGGSESGLTDSQAAAVEAFEEAGVQGSIEKAPFASYHRGKRSNAKESAAVENIVHAYLCEVLRLMPPQEPNRNRTWFPAEKAKRHLQQSRTPENGAELARVVDCAVARVQQLRSRGSVALDAMQEVQFEVSNAGFHGQVEDTSLGDGVAPRRGGGL